MHIKFSWNFHQNVFTLTIYFIALNVAIEFVLIYRPHPVLYVFNDLEKIYQYSDEKSAKLVSLNFNFLVC